MNGTNLNNYLKKQLRNKTFKKEWEASESQYQLVRQLISLRLKSKMSQKDMAKKAQTTQAVISRIETMILSPTLRMIDKLATALGKKVVVGLE